MAATIVTHNGRRCRVVYKKLAVAKIRTGYQIWDRNARDWATVILIERADRWGIEYELTTSYDNIEVTDTYGATHELRTRRYVPIADQPALVAMPDERNAGNITPLLKAGQTLTIRRDRGQRYQIKVTSVDTLTGSPDSSLLPLIYGQKLTMTGKRHWGTPRNATERPHCIFVTEIESIEEPTDGAQ